MNPSNTRWNKNKALSYIQDLSLAFQKSRTLLTAMHFDVFTLIGERSLSAEDVANQLDFSIRGVERLLNALAALDILIKKDFKFSNTESSKTFLVQGSPDYLGNMEHLSSLWDNWGDLNQAVATGEPVNHHEITEKDEDWIEAYVSSNHWKACVESSDIIKMINLRDVNKVLDLGGGTGKYAVEFVKAKPNIEAVVFDFPNVISHTEKYIGKSGLTDRITTIGGDFHKDDLGSGYDMVVISNVVQYQSIWDNVKMLQKVYDSLNINGQLVIHDQIIDDDRKSPQRAALYALNMLINTKSGNCYTETDLWIMMKEAWFKNIKRVDTNFETSLMLGER